MIRPEKGYAKLTNQVRQAKRSQAVGLCRNLSLGSCFRTMIEEKSRNSIALSQTVNATGKKHQISPPPESIRDKLTHAGAKDKD